MIITIWTTIRDPERSLTQTGVFGIVSDSEPLRVNDERIRFIWTPKITYEAWDLWIEPK